MAIDSIDTFKDLGLKVEEPKTPQKKELGQDTFLKLMTTQLTNQNPLKPMENTEFLTQMAQFGTVSGIADLQKSFSEFASSVSSEQALQAAGLVGRQVKVSSDEATLAAGGEIAGSFELPTGASHVTVNIMDSNGALVKKIPISNQQAGEVTFAWDGFLEDGSLANPGKYKIQTEAVIDDNNKALETYTSAQVESVTMAKDQKDVSVSLIGLGDVKFNDIKQIF